VYVRITELSGWFCVAAFRSYTEAISAFHLINVFNGISKNNAKVCRVTVQHKQAFIPVTLTVHNTVV
jgi:hypothetical protein